MMGSASCWRSYGFTQGSMLPQALSEEARATANTTLTAIPLFTDATSLFQQRADLIQIFAFIAGLVALVQVTHVAFAIDEHRARHRAHVIQFADLDRKSTRLNSS